MLRIGIVEGVVQRDGATRGVIAGGEVIEADAVVLTLGPWTDRAPGRSALPTVHGLKGYSVTLRGRPCRPTRCSSTTAPPTDAPRAGDLPRSRRRGLRVRDGRPAPLPDSAEAVEVSESACAALARAAGRVSTRLAAARIARRQACYRPVTDDGLPLIGRVPGRANAYVATGHGPWGMLNAPATGLALAELIPRAPPRPWISARSTPPGAQRLAPADRGPLLLAHGRLTGRPEPSSVGEWRLADLARSRPGGAGPSSASRRCASRPWRSSPGCPNRS